MRMGWGGGRGDAVYVSHRLNNATVPDFLELSVLLTFIGCNQHLGVKDAYAEKDPRP